MKFMKLGSKLDIFTVRGNSTSVASELPSDITFDVDGHKFHLHKFPLLAKWGCLNKLIASALESGSEEVLINEFPGGAKCFEMCAKYCYGITITLSPHNVGEVRCGAEFLQMTEVTEKSNMIYMLEVFLNSSILRGWKDTIICLRSSTAYMPWCEDLKIMGRCIESISSKACVNPAEVTWSFTYTPRQVSGIEQSSPGSWSSRRMTPAPKDWWVEDLSDLDIHLYGRVILAIKSRGAAEEMVAESIRIYLLRNLPVILQQYQSQENSIEGCYNFMETTVKYGKMLETVISLLPSEKGASSCRFLLKLLKATSFLEASPSMQLELSRLVGLQLEEASLQDLMIPSASYSNGSVCDVDLMICIMEHYLLQFKAPQEHERSGVSVGTVQLDSNVSEHRMTSITHSSQLKVAKLVDQYLLEIARDGNLPLAKFIQLAELVPDYARPVHDGLYSAVDMYLKEHPHMTKSERKKICRLMDCKKLSMDTCMHAAQNDRLPPRVVIQVLFFEQVRPTVNGSLPDDHSGSIHDPKYGEEINLPKVNNDNSRKSSIVDENWETVHHDFTVVKGDLASIKNRYAEAEKEYGGMQ